MFNIDYKIKKYSSKLYQTSNHTYLKKLSKYILAKYNIQSGGAINNFTIGPSHNDKLRGLITFIEQTLTKLAPLAPLLKDPTSKIPKTNYYILAMGPTGAGKTNARKIGFHIVSKLEKIINENEYNEENIKKSFIDISLDDYIDDAILNSGQNIDKRSHIYMLNKMRNSEKAVTQQMKEEWGRELEPHTRNKEKGSETRKLAVEKEVRSNNVKDLRTLLKKEQDNNDAYEAVKNISTTTYFNFRQEVDAIPMIMIHVAHYFKLNFIFETTVNGKWMPEYMLANIPDYFCIVVYPSTSALNLIERTKLRAVDNYRFVSDTLKEMEVDVIKGDTTWNEIKNLSIRNMYLYKYDNNEDIREIIEQKKFNEIKCLDKRFVVKGDVVREDDIMQ